MIGPDQRGPDPSADASLHETGTRAIDVVPSADYAWAPPVPADPAPLAGTALWLAIAGLGVSLFVGWGFPLGVGAIVVATVALRRPRERRAVALWAVGLAAASVLYSVGWLVWAFTRR